MTHLIQTRRLLNLVNGSTLLGLIIAKLGAAHIQAAPRGLFLACGYRPRFPFAPAFTVGNVIIMREILSVDDAITTATFQHEEKHSVQYAYCLGLPFFPTYLVTMAWSWLRTGDRGAACFFEQEAGLETGGYQQLPKRSVITGIKTLFTRVDTVSTVDQNQPGSPAKL